MTYLDWNATAPLSPAAREALLPWLGPPTNPSSVHARGQAAAAALDDARATLAAAFSWPAAGVVFTSGATEANALALHHGRWLGSVAEHPSVTAWAPAALPVDDAGRVLPDAVPTALAAVAPSSAPVTGLAIQLASNETGVVQPLPALLAACRAAGLRLHVDAAQAPGRIPLPWAADPALRPTSVTLSGHKLGAPVGIGVLLVDPASPPAALLPGAQERGLRGGTPAVALAVALAAAATSLPPPDPTLRDQLEAGLVALGGQPLGAHAPRLPNTTCVRFPGLRAADLVLALDLEGIAVSAGAACSSGSVRPSPLLLALGAPEGAVRYSLGPPTSRADVTAALAATERVLARVRRVE